jgi:hypothetical protein
MIAGQLAKTSGPLIDQGQATTFVPGTDYVRWMSPGISTALAMRIVPPYESLRLRRTPWQGPHL